MELFYKKLICAPSLKETPQSCVPVNFTWRKSRALNEKKNLLQKNILKLFDFPMKSHINVDKLNFYITIRSEAAIRGVLWKKVFLEISQN